MKKIRSLFTALIIFSADPLWSATYYVLPEGGTYEQCNGRFDTAYPGTGTGLNCAWAHPFWALNSDGAWRIQGSDTLIIHSGSYRMGYGSPNTGWCESDYAWDCHLPPLPSGKDVQNPTRLVGAGWNSQCTHPPELWGAERAYYVINLTGTSNASMACLELTDHSSCAEFHPDTSTACQRETYPYGNWASTGLTASDSANVDLSDLNIHGFAVHGILAGRLTNWTVRNVRLAGNGWIGWEGDIEGEDSNSGTLAFQRWLVEWNGCPETWPGQTPNHCWEQESGGYGDGVGTGATGGHWIIEDSAFRYNTSDGLDLLYVGRAGSGSKVEVRRTVSVGNLGNQIKIGGPAALENNLMISNCGYFYGKPFAQEVADYCRAGGNTLALSLHQGNASTVVNNTIVGEGDVLIEAECDNETSTCNGTETVMVQNNIFMGYAEFEPGGGEDQTNLQWDPSGMMTGHMDYNLIYNVRNQEECPIGTNDLCNDPLFINALLGGFDGRLRKGSPALDSGLATGPLIPTDAFEGNSRPFGSGIDRGAYELADGPAAELRVNGSSIETNANLGAMIPVDIALTARSRSGEAADWWLVVQTPVGWSSYNAYIGQWEPGIVAGYQGNLTDLKFGQLSVNFLPTKTGSHRFYFGVDMNDNRYLDIEQIYYGSIGVTVTE